VSTPTPGYAGLAGTNEGPNYAGPIIRAYELEVDTLTVVTEVIASYIYDGPAYFWAWGDVDPIDGNGASAGLFVIEDVGIEQGFPLQQPEWQLDLVKTKVDATLGPRVVHLPPRRTKIRFSSGLTHSATWFAALVPLYVAEEDGTIIPRPKSAERG